MTRTLTVVEVDRGISRVPVRTKNRCTVRPCVRRTALCTVCARTYRIQGPFILDFYIYTPITVSRTHVCPVSYVVHTCSLSTELSLRDIRPRRTSVRSHMHMTYVALTCTCTCCSVVVIHAPPRGTRDARPGTHASGITTHHRAHTHIYVLRCEPSAHIPEARSMRASKTLKFRGVSFHARRY